MYSYHRQLMRQRRLVCNPLLVFQLRPQSLSLGQHQEREYHQWVPCYRLRMNYQSWPESR